MRVISIAMNRPVEPYTVCAVFAFFFIFIVPSSNKAALNDLLFTPAPLPFPCFVERASSVPQGARESLRAPCDDQRVLE